MTIRDVPSAIHLTSRSAPCGIAKTTSDPTRGISSRMGSTRLCIRANLRPGGQATRSVARAEVSGVHVHQLYLAARSTTSTASVPASIDNA
jgi:hypothetical protein